ncbi:MAG: YfdX family protein [Verrucomicrobiota bacterium]|nr:YfdX family protein [Verrucomicrobiota bacterium]
MGLIGSPAMLSAQESKAPGSNALTTGSGDRYKTTITQETKGELKPEDARQISVLGSRVLTHLRNASRFLGEEKPDQAKAEIEHAQTLAKAVRDMLPVTIVSTTTRDAQGKEIYRYEDRVQEDQIPIVEGLINVQVVQPIIEGKKEQAALKGLQLADADLIHTAILLDLDYVESKIRQALAKLKEPEKAQTELLAASAIGVRFSTGGPSAGEHPGGIAARGTTSARREIRWRES